jgi:hypothetical protein
MKTKRPIIKRCPCCKSVKIDVKLRDYGSMNLISCNDCYIKNNDPIYGHGVLQRREVPNVDGS